ncbi:uridine kinase [Catellatospora sp. TT07R-123]|uniref:uridine kinase n=1 Tax=Catellatospora sp. TT07R-123 TaxID=2733863 RepID=UPI001B0BF5C9|nr:uridine kinase [Catellatospora sp. TT07R-123]GHJ48432.1 uridine kinase [Catellatospora sp. TT07R-123]
MRAISPSRLRDELTGRIAALAAERDWTRVAVDGAPAAGPDELAADLVAPLRALGHEVLHVRTADFLRPASLRLEFGRTNPDSFYEGWVDEAGLRREVLDPARPGGTGRVLPTLWDAGRDRATRAPYQALPPGSVVLVSGAFLLGAGLPFELAVHLRMSAAALARRTPPELAWTLPAYARYDGEVAPHTFADVAVALNDPRHPALMT